MRDPNMSVIFGSTYLVAVLGRLKVARIDGDHFD
jgi:hypothetical protein